MINENALRDALLSLATDGRSNYVMISSVLNELAAIREIVRGLVAEQLGEMLCPNVAKLAQEKTFAGSEGVVIQ